MTSSVDSILERLRTSDGGPTAELAALLVDDARGRTVGELVDAKVVARALRDVLVSLTASDAAAKHVATLLAQVNAEVAAERRALSTAVPPALQQGARAVAELPLTVPREVVTKLLDREPVRKLLRAQVIDTLVAFGRKAASPVADNPIARGLGGLSKRALGQVTSKPSALGALATAVSGEVERQVEKRATDFADTALDGILAGIADQLGDPARAKEQAALRVALLEGALELDGPELAAIGRVPFEATVAAVRKALAAWAASASFEGEVEAAVGRVLERDADKTLRTLLDDLGVTKPVTDHARAVVSERLAALFATDPFAAWLRALLA